MSAASSTANPNPSPNPNPNPKQEDIECGVVYSSAEHLATQMSFVTSGYAERARLDFQIKLHNISHDLEHLGGALGYVRPEGSPPVAPNLTAVWKCPLGRENTVEGKGKLAVSKADFVAVLAKHPALVQRLCTVYFQDYIWCARLPPRRAPRRARMPLSALAACLR